MSKKLNIIFFILFIVYTIYMLWLLTTFFGVDFAETSTAENGIITALIVASGVAIRRYVQTNPKKFNAEE